VSIHPTAADVQSYYNGFLQTRMLGYRLHGNIRIDLAANFFLKNISADSIIVDIGCGIGIATELMAKKARGGRVIGLDISDQNIWYANKTISIPHLSFHCLDVVDNPDAIKELAGRHIDIFTLCDVIEHIPESDRIKLFRQIAEIGSPSVKILLTIPSEFYQEHLRVENPGELQIIDNTITAMLLDREAREAGFALSYFQLVDVWNKVQYAHCTLQRMESLNDSVKIYVTPAKPNPLIDFTRRVINKVYLRRRQQKYVDDVFGFPRTTVAKTSTRDINPMK
jgi:trans-aconitate 2-methyltransferase